MALYVNGNANISFSNCSFVNVRTDNSTAIGLTNMMQGSVTITSSKFSNIRGSLGSALLVNNSRVPIVIQQTVFLNSSAASGGAIYILKSVHNKSFCRSPTVYFQLFPRQMSVELFILDSLIKML